MHFMSHLCTKQIECPNLVWTQYSINRYIARRQLRRGLEISAACALWSFTPTFALLLGLGYPTRDQGVPRRWPSAKQWSKHWNPLTASIRSTGLQWLPTVQVGTSTGSNDSRLLRRVSFDTYQPLGNFVPMFPIPLFCALSPFTPLVELIIE